MSSSMAEERFVVEIEKGKEATEGRPSMGPAYRSIFAKDGLTPPVQGLDSCWDIFRSFLLFSLFLYIFSISYLHAMHTALRTGSQHVSLHAWNAF